MILDAKELPDGALLQADLVVVGSGPAGIVVALEVARQGFDVLILESGDIAFDADSQTLSDAAQWDQRMHAPMSMAVRRQLGGTSAIWGGRAVPYDPVDFEHRPFITDATWPFDIEEVRRFEQRACDWLVCGRAVFDARDTDHLPPSIVPGFVEGDVRSSSLERWSLPTDFGREYRHRLEESRHVVVVKGLTCTEIVTDGVPSVERVEGRTGDGKSMAACGVRYVVACGGLESTRLLLASRGPGGRSVGDHSGHLGRWYMSHLEGVIANVRFTTPPQTTVYDYERDVDGVFVRRRLSFSPQFMRDHELPNVVAWLANPLLADAHHRSGPLSFAYLALASPLGSLMAPDAQRRSLTGEEIPGAPYPGVDPGPLREHLVNLLREPARTADFVWHFGVGRFLRRRPRTPGFFVERPDNCYPLQFHGEHRPNATSTVSLTGKLDAIGMPRLKIDIAFDQADIDGIMAAHRHWDAYLRSTQVGSLQYTSEDPVSDVWAQIGGGFHQMGTTRMSVEPADGVVDEHLAVHGFDDLFVASSSTFVTSSQANSTFMLVVLAVRLADELRAQLAALRSSCRIVARDPQPSCAVLTE